MGESYLQFKYKQYVNLPNVLLRKLSVVLITSCIDQNLSTIRSAVVIIYVY